MQFVNIEKIIRPFQIPDISPARAVARKSAGTKETEPVTYQCGKGGSVKSVGVSYSITTSYYMDQKVKEQKKTSG